MKKVLIICICAIALVSCSKDTQQSKSEKLIKNWIEHNLDDPGSYSPISFSSVDSLFCGEIDGVGVAPITTRESLKDGGYRVGKFDGFIVIHQYRAKNKAGGMQKYNHSFYFDKSISKIEDDDIDE